MLRLYALPAAVVAFALVGPTAPVKAQQTSPASADSAAVVQVIREFHAALAAADSATVLGLLADDAVILESGDVETKQEYRSHHLPADIAFARAVPRGDVSIRVALRGDVAWASSTSVVRGRFRDREVSSQSAELMVLERRGERWVVSAIHWSSRPLR